MYKQDVNALQSEQDNFFKKILSTFRKKKIHLSYWLINKMKISQRELEPAPTIFTRIGDLILKPFINKDLMSYILMGPFCFQIFRVAHELGLFSYLNTHHGATLDEISTHLKIEKYPTEILLLGLTGIKVIKKIKDLYYISGLTKIITQDTNNKFTYFFPKYMQYAHHILYHGIHPLKESLQENKPMGLQKIFGSQATDYYFELSKNKTTNQYFSEHMSAFSQINAERLATLSLFKKMNSLLDVGGGVGDVALSIAKFNSELKITVYDHPTVAELANQKFDEANLAHKLNAIGADVMTNPFPENYDGILFSHFIDIFSPEINKDFFTRAFSSLKSKGHIIVYTPVVNDDESGPLVNCILGIYFLSLANGKGRFYTAAQISNWMKEIGFTHIKTKRLPSSEAIITAMKP